MGRVPLQWHPAFCSSLQIELEGEPLLFFNEYNLTRKPMQIDVLVIKKTSARTIRKSIGKIFRTHNIVEFKSPDDTLSINDFYKVLGYACIYQANTEKVMEIQPDEITMSFVVNHYPRHMINWVKRIHGAEVEQKQRGIYYLNGLIFPTQVIVIKELSKQENRWLARLRPGLNAMEDLNVLAEEYKEKQNNPLYSTCMDVILRANPDTTKEGSKMCQALVELMYELYGDQLKEDVAREVKKEVAKELAKEVAKEVAKEKKRAGTIVIIDLIRKKIQKNHLEPQIADELELDVGIVQQICKIVRTASLEVSNEEIYEKWSNEFAIG